MEVGKSRIAYVLKRLREERNYSQEYVAEKLGKNDSTAYSRIEQGRTELKYEDALKLALLYKIPMESIYDPNYTEKDIDAFREERPHYFNQSKLNLSITLDGSLDTLHKQFELLKKVNELLA